ncbi:hypothetical protein [Duganella vulcania]|uniref:Uncharacterized protein n=1 Tax=Duganella vulcania TaxID=2692166 RepID=A0A845GFX5_9BURK|nr:hypothetical protein [Duganella vulcania]MYM92410.1 hypothetical protein [Duganella vulcania]
MSKKMTEKRDQLLKSREDLKQIKLLRQKVRFGVPGAAGELEARRQARILRNAVKSPLEQIHMEPKRL